MPAEGTEFVSLAQLKDYDTNRVAIGLGLKLNAPASAGTDGQMLVYGASGNQWMDVPEDTAYSADDETLQLSGTQFSVKDGGITTAKVASGAITADKMASGVIPDVSGFATKTRVDEISDTVATTKWLKPANEISAGTDLDTLTEPGSWFCDDPTSVTNAPDDVAGGFLLYVYSGRGVVAHELHTPFGTWWRWKREGGGPWDTWARVLAPIGPLPIGDGGTGATSADGAMKNLAPAVSALQSKVFQAMTVTATRRGNVVTLRVYQDSGASANIVTTSSWTNVAQLKAGCYPTEDVVALCGTQSSNGAWLQLGVTTAGVVRIRHVYVGSNVSWSMLAATVSFACKAA